jgi:adenylate cyclase
LQDRVALSVAGVIEPTVHAAESRRAARRPLESLGSYDLYLRAAALRVTLQKDQVLEAIELLDAALKLQPDFAPALGQAAGCHSQVCANKWADDTEAHRRRGLEMAERALAAGPDDPSVLAQTANALVELDGDVHKAAGLIDRATTLNPGSAYAWFVSGIVELVGGEPDAAIEHLQAAARLDPISRLGDIARAHVPMALAIRGDFEEAARHYRATTYRTPRIHLMMAAVYGHLGRLAEAHRELKAYARESAVPAEVMANSIGGKAEALALLREGLRRILSEGPA